MKAQLAYIKSHSEQIVGFTMWSAGACVYSFLNSTRTIADTMADTSSDSFNTSYTLSGTFCLQLPIFMADHPTISVRPYPDGSDTFLWTAAVKPYLP